MSPTVLLLIVLAVVAVALFVLKSRGEAADPAAPPTASKPVKKLHWLVQRTADGEQVVWHIGQRRVTAGRGPTNFVQITDPRASRKQCQLAPEGDDLVITDMTSSNGTFVNGTVVRRKVLADGDVIKLVDAEFTYHRHGDFEGNAGLGRKDAGKNTLRTTKVHRDLGKAARADMMLEAMDGDLDKAAAAMDVTVEDFKELIA